VYLAKLHLAVLFVVHCVVHNITALSTNLAYVWVYNKPSHLGVRCKFVRLFSFYAARKSWLVIDKVVLQIHALDAEMKLKMTAMKGCLSSSAVVILEWSSQSFSQPVTV